MKFAPKLIAIVAAGILLTSAALRLAEKHQTDNKNKAQQSELTQQANCSK